MENILLKQIVSMLIIVCMLTPLNGVIADDPLNKPDIELSFDECIHPTENESDYTFILRIQNRGMNVAENISVIVYCDTPGDLLLNETITSLNSQQFHNLSFEWNNTPGDYQFFAIADEDNVINESNEENNEDFFFLTVREEQYINLYSTYGNCRYTWREGEYFNDSRDFGGVGAQWDTPTETGTSNDSYAETRNALTNGDWAEWDFDVELSDTYYFWFRHRYGDQCSNTVKFYWDSYIISTENWYDSSNSGWKWTCIGNKSLSSGGTLKIVGDGTMTRKHYLNVDNILITNQENFTIEDGDFGEEGYNDYVIGYNTAPSTPNVFQPQNGATNVAVDKTLSWSYCSDPENDEVYYDVYLEADDSNPSACVASDLTSPSYTPDDPFDDDTEYYWKVMAKDEFDASSISSVWHFHTEIFEPTLEYSNHAVDDSTGGDNDGKVEPGETIQLEVWIKNSGEETAHDVWATIDTASSDITIIDDNASYGNIYPGASKQSIDDYVFEVNYNKIDTMVILFDMTIHSDEGIWDDMHTTDFDIVVYLNPKIQYDSHTIDDSSGNNDGFVNAGETIDVSVTLENIGPGSSSGVYAYLSTSDPDITINDDYSYYGNMEVDELDVGDGYNFSIDLDHDEVDAMFILDIYDGESEHWADSFNVSIYEAPASVTVTDYTVDDDYTGESFGSDNGLVEGGEIIELEVTLTNNGGSLANNVTAVLTENDADVTVTEGSCSFGDLAADESVEGIFVFEVDVEHIGESDVEFSLDISDDDGNSWEDSIYLDIYECPGLNYQYVKEKTKSLSDVIFTAYDIGDLRRGRAFGSDGEHAAANYIVDWMNGEIGLSNVDTDPIENTTVLGDLEVNEVVESNAIGLQIDTTGTGGYQMVDCFMSNRWNNTLFCPWGQDDRGELTYNFSNWNDPVGYRVKKDYTYYFTDVITEFITNSTVFNSLTDAVDNGTITDFESYYTYLVALFESYYSFSFNDSMIPPSFFTSDDAPEQYDMNCYDITGNCNNKYFLIFEDPWNHPDDEDFWPEFMNSDPYSFLSIFFKWGRMMLKLWWVDVFRNNCEGIILYDHNMDCHNMVNLKGRLPLIFINGTEGQEIMTALDAGTTVRMKYYLNQEFNTSIESYNVIGEIPGSNPEGTIIVGCLYDSLWCQGTTDSAIGVGLMLGIADYFKRNQITPEWNLKFIAYGGEEKGYLGAYAYEEKYRNSEDIVHLIDLNQLGFTERTDTPLNMSIVCNNEEIRDVSLGIAERTNYEQRVDYSAGFNTWIVNDGGPSDSNPFASNRPSINTMLFIKDTGWTLHHRDGEGHYEGDAMKYYNYTDVHVVGEMLLNVTKELAMYDPDVDLSVSDTFFNIGSVVEGNTVSDDFEVWNSGDGIMEYIIESSESWITVDESKHIGLCTVEEDTIVFSVDTEGLSSGTHSGVISVISDHETINITVQVSVVSSDPVLSCSLYSYDFGSMQGNETDSMSFEIWNSGAGLLSYSLNESCSWLKVNPSSGFSSGEHDTISVSVNTSGLSSGSYQCNVSITSNGGSGVFSVNVTVVEYAEVLDVNQSLKDKGFPIRDAVDGAWGGAQNFTPTVSTITRVEVYLRVFGTPEFNLTAELRVDNPEGTLIDSVVISPENVSLSWEWLSIDFVDVSVTPGVTYCIVLQPPGEQNTSFGYEWGYWSQGSVYGGGAFYFTRDGGDLWRDLPDSYDFTFRTYGYS